MGDPVWDRRLLCSSRGKKEQAAGGEDGGRTQGEEKERRTGEKKVSRVGVLPVQMKQSEKSEDGSPRVIRLSRRGDGNNRP